MKKNKIVCDGGGDTVESLIAGDVHGGSNLDFWGEFSQVVSNSSKSVVSIALSDGNNMLFACSGIAIEHQGYDTRFLTSANLASTFNDKTKDHDNLKVEVCHEGDIVLGVLGKCDFRLGIAVVNVRAFLDVQVVLHNHLMEFVPCGKVVALGRDISGKLMATSGMLTPDASGSEDSQDLIPSTCEISEDWVGGPLFDIEGNFVGMNLSFVKERTLFLPASTIFERLLHFWMPLSKFPAQLENLKVGRTLKKDKRTDGFTRSTNDITDDLARSSNKNKGTDDLANSSKKNKKTCDGGEKITSDFIGARALNLEKDKRTVDLTRSKNNITDDLARSSNKNKGTDDLSNSCKKNKTTCNGGGKTADPFVSDVLNEDPFCNLDSMGYSKLVRDVPERLVLVNTFEDTFGDIYGGGVWSELSETASSNMSQNVVSLASFYGEKRIFACTGSFIEWNGCVTILTSASLVSQFVGDQKIAENLRIEVLLPNEDYIGGALQHYNLHYNVALVNVKDFTAHNPVNIEPQRSKYSSELVAVGRCFKSGVLMAARGKHTSMLHKLDCKLVKYSTCKITKAGIGGPLVDSDGKFIGMNFCGIDLYAMNLHDVKRTWTPFLSSDVILNVLAYFKTKRTVAEVGLDGYASGGLDWVIDGDSSVRPNSWPVPKANLYPRQFLDLEAPPKPKIRIRVHNPVVRIIDGKEHWFM